MLCVLRNLEEDGESGTQSLMLEKGWWQGLAQLLVRQKDMSAGAQLLSPFLFSLVLKEQCCPQLEQAFLIEDLI